MTSDDLIKVIRTGKQLTRIDFGYVKNLHFDQKVFMSLLNIVQKREKNFTIIFRRFHSDNTSFYVPQKLLDETRDQLNI